MTIQSTLSALSICVLASFGVAACSANTDEAPQEPPYPELP